MCVCAYDPRMFGRIAHHICHNMYVCVCVRERERERESVCVSVCVLCVCVCVHVRITRACFAVLHATFANIAAAAHTYRTHSVVREHIL